MDLETKGYRSKTMKGQRPLLLPFLQKGLRIQSGNRKSKVI